MHIIRRVHRAVLMLLLLAGAVSACAPAIANGPFAHSAREHAIRACMRSTGAEWGHCAWTLYQVEQIATNTPAGTP